MTGWRIGYAGGPEWLIKAMSKIQSQSTSNPNSIAQWASKAALEGEMTFLKSNLVSFEKRRNFVVEGLNKVNGLKCKMPNGAFYVFPNCEGVLGKKTPKGKVLNSDKDYCDYLLEEGLVATVPGIAFGLSPYFRISYATSDENLKKAIERIQNVTNKLI
jgi:aspartate aminotransferase